MNFVVRKRRAPTIIIVSLVDILIILLIFFVVSTTFKKDQPEVQINLPESKTATKTPAELEHALVDLRRVDALVRHGVAFDDIDVIWVPGAWELPLAARHAMARDRYEAIVALGAVIRGDTPHFEYVCREASRGVIQASLDTGLPVSFGLLTTDNLEQAEARAGGSAGNKGAEAADAAVMMAQLMRALPSGHRRV